MSKSKLDQLLYLERKTQLNIKNKERTLTDRQLAVRVLNKEAREAEEDLSKEHRILESIQRQIKNLQIREAV